MTNHLKISLNKVVFYTFSGKLILLINVRVDINLKNSM